MNAADTIVGLTAAEVAERRAQHGPNELVRTAGTSPWRILVRQFASPIIWLLLVAVVISALLGELADAVAIASILLLNALIGFFQEYRAERAVLALRSMTAPRARVLRDGAQTIVAARDVVPGDILALEAGEVVAADATLLEANGLSTNEAPLTGESVPVRKSVEPRAISAELAEQTHRVFLGTSVVGGTGYARVSETGMKTELGRIAHLLASVVDAPTPLQQRLAHVSRTLLIASIAIVIVVAAITLVRGAPVIDVFFAAVALAVAAVPEALPAVVTIALAVGVRRMAARHALVRQLQAVETLGSTTVICTDKTGTLTTGVMTVRELWGPDHQRLLDGAAACCDAEVDGTGGAVGDPTEVAILIEARIRKIERPAIERERPRTRVIPFDADLKYMAVERADGTTYVKGAPEVILERCASGTEGGNAAAAQMAERGLRVLAVAIAGPLVGDGLPQELELLGLIGLADPPRTEAITAVAAARAAGIRTVMITGDHPRTANAIARELGIVTTEDDATVLVHARATPATKLEIVRDWKKRGEVVAMTGDGVNDAPALREAHVGIAMGKTGTEVTREASDMVLADDNFATIVEAVREGRGIFANIRKSLVFVLAGNVAEISVMLFATIGGLPLPFLPLQLLWINLITDGLPALALVMDPVERDAMNVPPRPVREPILGSLEWRTIVFVGLVETAVTFGAFLWALETTSLEEARGLAFSVLVFSQMFCSLAARSTTRVFWTVGAFGNVLLLAVVMTSIAVQAGLSFVEPLRQLFGLPAPSLRTGLLALGLGLIPVTIVELAKLARYGTRPARP